MNAAITATGKYLPPDKLTNFDFEKMFETSDEWIRTRTGIIERRILKDPNKATAFMCAEAAKDLLAKRKISAEEIDVIIVATVTPDMFFPATACLVQDAIGAKNAWGFDLSAACSGFLFALTTGSQFIKSGAYKKVLVIGGDKMSAIIDYTKRDNSILFGDAAACVLLEPTDEPLGIIDYRLYTDGSGKDHLHQWAGGSLRPPTHETIDKRQHYIHQDGKIVFKAAVIGMAEVAAEIMTRNHLKAEDVAYLVPHQANLRIISATAERMGIGMDKVCVNISKYGNTTAATVPLCLVDLEEEKKTHKGSNLVIATYGAGYTWGGLYLKWLY